MGEGWGKGVREGAWRGEIGGEGVEETPADVRLGFIWIPAPNGKAHVRERKPLDHSQMSGFAPPPPVSLHTQAPGRRRRRRKRRTGCGGASPRQGCAAHVLTRHEKDENSPGRSTKRARGVIFIVCRALARVIEAQG